MLSRNSMFSGLRSASLRTGHPKRLVIKASHRLANAHFPSPSVPEDSCGERRAAAMSNIGSFIGQDSGLSIL